MIYLIINATAPKKELRDSAAFAAFKRWLIWDNEMFSEIEQFIPEN